jgi:hypothetical protein
MQAQALLVKIQQKYSNKSDKCTHYLGIFVTVTEVLK